MIKKIIILAVVIVLLFGVGVQAYDDCNMGGCPGVVDVMFCTNVNVSITPFWPCHLDEECKVFWDMRYTGLQCNVCYFEHEDEYAAHYHTEYHDICEPDVRNVCPH